MTPERLAELREVARSATKRSLRELLDYVDELTARAGLAEFSADDWFERALVAERKLADMTARAEAAESVLRNYDFRRCNSPACNCGSWQDPADAARAETAEQDAFTLNAALMSAEALLDEARGLVEGLPWPEARAFVAKLKKRGTK